MPARYFVVDVFAREPLAGNALAVFPDPGSVHPSLMQKIARETNLSETTFVTAIRDEGYDVRIFTPFEEMPFAGHPTLGTSWTLKHLGVISREPVIQRSPAGETPVTFEQGRVWLERSGTTSDDIKNIDRIVEALGISESDVGFKATLICGSSAKLRPAKADAGIPILIVPLANPGIVASLSIPMSVEVAGGVYCIAPLAPGRIKARFFAPGLGVMEDPATGGAAAALGVYLGARVGNIDVEIEQGAEIARPSLISLSAGPGRARVGGAVHLVLEGSLVL
jgi:trans-2,3-dihydro-3-hydroxyanthranilate isomerase